MKKLVCAAAAIALSAMAFMPMQASAQVGVSITVGNAPPPMRYEEIPPPRYGYVWVPGYWDWDGWQYVWHEGYWLPERAGYFYEAPYWYQGSGGWYLKRGDWHAGVRHGRPGQHSGYGRSDWSHDRHDGRHDSRHDGRGRNDGNHGGFGRGDRDRDGVPDRVDRDRDGDGVSNRRDARPDNAHRR